jgi:hypothetical protein
MNEEVLKALVGATLPPAASQADELVPGDLPERNVIGPLYNFEEFRQKCAAAAGVDLSEPDDIIF